MKKLSIIVCFLIGLSNAYAQEVMVVDQKGTKNIVNNNSVTTALTAPTTPVEGDVWLDTTTNTTKIWDATAMEWKQINTWLGYKTIHHMVGTTLAITDVLHNNTDIHIESTGEVSLASTAVNDGTNFYITNTTGIARALSFTGFAGAFLRNGGAVTDVKGGTGLVLKANTRYLCHVTKNGTDYYFNATEAGSSSGGGGIKEWVPAVAAPVGTLVFYNGVIYRNFGGGNSSQPPNINITNWEQYSGISIADDDGDTKIQVEETTDEDKIRFDTAGTERMIISSTGDVGIGTVTPASLLTLKNGGNIEFETPSSTAGTASIVRSHAKINLVKLASNSDYISFQTHHSGVSAGERMRIAENGNVGIGTTAPAARLDVRSSMGSNTGGLIIMHSNASRGLSFGFGGIVGTGSNASSSLTIDSKGTGNLLLNTTATGNVGIGTATPKSKLDVEGGLAVGATYSGTTAAPANGAIIEGNVGVGTTTPSYKLHVKGDVYADGGWARVQGDKGLYFETHGTGLRSPISEGGTFGSVATLGGEGGWEGYSIGGKYVFMSDDANSAGIYNDTDNKWITLFKRNDYYRIYESDGGNVAVTVNNTGGVGIGTTDPKSKLDVEGSLAVGATYSGTTAAPANGAIIQGNVGIGTANPTHPLHVVGSTNQVVASHRFGEGGLGDGRQWSVFANYGHNIGIYATESIRTDGVFLASSDKRIKKDIFVSNSKEDLKTIENIEITNYKYINVFEKGDLMQKKVIAQQVEEVYPTAVGKTKSFIPNIYAVAESVETSNTNLVRLSLAEPHGLIKGDIVRIEGKTGGTEQLEVLLVDENSFTVKIEKPQEDYFVFGKQVDDFRVVDYDALTTLNISATQELVKRIEMLEKKNELLEKTNATLRKENSNTDKNYNELKAELEIIKQAVFQYAEK